MDSKQPNKQPVPKWMVGVTSAALAVLVFVGGTYAFYALSYRNEILPNTVVAGVSVGGLTLSDAEARILEHIRSFEQTPVAVTVASSTVKFESTQVDASYDANATAQAAYQLGRSNNVWDNLVVQIGAAFQPTSVDLTVTYSDEALEKYLDELSTRFDDPEQNAGVEYTKGAVVIVDEAAGQRFDRIGLQAVLREAVETATHPTPIPVFPLLPYEPTVTRADVEPLVPTIQTMVLAPLVLGFETTKFTVDSDQLTEWITIERLAPAGRAVEGFLDSAGSAVVSFNAEEITGYAKTLAAEIAQEPVDAKLTIKNGKATVFQSAQDGRQLDETKTAAAITEALEARRSAARAGTPIATAGVALPVVVTKPTVTSSTVEDLGIQELIGSATTDFSGSPDNRIHNIKTGTKYLNGWLLKPGEEFSTVKALGEVDGSTGYLPELVIKENRTIPEYGGGLCQVSTTLFRSVLNAGLPVTERRNHSYRVSYYERGIGPGLDATVYLPKPDFRFKNDTPGWILVQGSVSGLKVTFELYGTNDGRVASVDGPHTLSTTPAPDPIHISSDQLAPGEVKQLEKAHDGASTVATYTVKRGDEVINRQVFESKYKALPAQYLEGPKQEAQAESQPSEGEVAGAQDSQPAENADQQPQGPVD